MKSRKTTVFLIFWGMCFPLKSYTQVLTTLANAPREGDLLHMVQVVPPDAGEAGRGRLWDFSDLHEMDSKLKVEHMLVSDPRRQAASQATAPTLSAATVFSRLLRCTTTAGDGSCRRTVPAV